MLVNEKARRPNAKRTTWMLAFGRDKSSPSAYSTHTVMPSKIISDFCDRYWLTLVNHKGVEKAGQKPDGVWWIVCRDGWFRPCWIHLSEYSPECIRIRNDIRVPIPKLVWPLDKPAVGGCEQFELTFHESELQDGIHELIFSSSSIPGFRIDSPLFDKSKELPGYGWTIKAKKHHDATSSAGSISGRR